MSLKKQTAVLLSLVFATFFAQSQEILFVSAVGAGTTFSKEQPGNIEGLTSKLREVRSKHPGTIIVFFRGGEYLLNQSLTITNHETGTKKDSLILMGIQGEKVTLSGGRKITQWEKSGKGIFKAKVPAGTDFRQLYVNGKMAVRARTPNRENNTDFGPYYRGLGFDLKNQTIKVNSAEIPKWNNRDDAELVFNQHWYQSRVRIEAIKTEKDTAYITPLLPARKHFFQLYASMLKPGKPYYFENALGFLDQGGEWYLDKVENVLYYMPVQGEDLQKTEVIYPVLETIVNVSGETTKPVFNLSLKNLRLAYTNWTTPSRDGLIATQAVQGRGYSALDDRAVIEVKFAVNFSVTNCEVIGAGFHGVVFSKGVKNSKIQYCHLDQICANGVVIDTYKKSFPVDSLICKNDRVADNLIENFGMNYTNGMALLASCVAGLVVENNEIRFGMYTGMQIGNHYGDNLSGMRDNLIRRNNIHHVMRLHDDGGAIYTLALQPGTKIIENWMHDFGRSSWADNYPVNGVFLDNNSGYIRVQDNVFTNLNAEIFHIKEQCAGNATTRDNVLDNNNTQNIEVKNESGVRGKAGLLQ
jgi:hypothetical protein